MRPPTNTVAAFVAKFDLTGRSRYQRSAAPTAPNLFHNEECLRVVADIETSDFASAVPSAASSSSWTSATHSALPYHPLLLSSDVSVLSSVDDAATTFEPIAPDATALVAFGSVFVISVVAGLVWAYGVVPVSRTKLAISKSRGEVSTASG